MLLQYRRSLSAGTRGQGAETLNLMRSTGRHFKNAVLVLGNKFLSHDRINSGQNNQKSVHPANVRDKLCLWERSAPLMFISPHKPGALKFGV